MAAVGVEEVTLSLGTERVSHRRQRFGGRRVSYRHYLGELSRKPQAVRQVAPELLAELGEPSGSSPYRRGKVGSRPRRASNERTRQRAQ